MRRGRPGRLIDGMFRNRKTGRITVAQFPNVALWLFLIAVILRWLLTPNGQVATTLRLLTAGALIWWAVDELIRGVNPWRRLLGGTVLAGQIVQYAAG